MEMGYCNVGCWRCWRDEVPYLCPRARLKENPAGLGLKNKVRGLEDVCSNSIAVNPRCENGHGKCSS